MVPEVPCSEHVPNIVFRTCSERPGLLFSQKKSLRDAHKTSSMRNYTFSKHVYTSRFRKIEFSKLAYLPFPCIPKSRYGKSMIIWEHVPNMFRTFGSEQCSVPTKCICESLIYTNQFTIHMSLVGSEHCSEPNVRNMFGTRSQIIMNYWYLDFWTHGNCKHADFENSIFRKREM